MVSMGRLSELYNTIFKKKQVPYAPSYETFTESAPSFTPYTGGIYRQELTRAAIDRFATACSKLEPNITGSSHPAINRAFNTYPNDKQTWPQFLYRLATIYECDATAYVVKVFAADDQTVTGLWPVKCETADIVSINGEPWVVFHFLNGPDGYMELANTLILSKYQYESDFFGTDNCINDTMQLMDAQSQAQKSAIKNGAKIRFIAALNSQVRPEDLKKKREEFVANNLGADNEEGLLLYDQTFSSLQQIEPQAYTMDSGEMERIQDSVCIYFGTNMKILRNEYDEECWDAYYEGRIEPFATLLGEGLTKLLFTQREMKTNNITFSSNRLQYASSPSKRNMVRDMVDRSIMTLNEGREILQLPPIEGGDMRIIRGEYKDAEMITEVGNDVAVSDAELVDRPAKDADSDIKKPDVNPEYGDLDT